MTTAIAAQAEIDADTHAAYVANGENKAATARALGINASTVADRVKRHLTRHEQDTLADSRALDAAQAAQDAEYAADSEASPYVADPDNPTDDELAAAIQRGLTDGSLVDAADWMAEHEAETAEQAPAALPDPVHHGDVFARIETGDPEVRAIRETEAAFAGKPVTEDPDESVTALLEDGEPAQPDGAADADVTAQPGPGQAADNIVHEMACGHEYDSPVELASGQPVECSAHGPTEIAGAPEPSAQPAPVKASRFPEGIVTPYEFRDMLVAEGFVPEKSIRYLAYKWAAEEPDFPARFYAKDGAAYDEKQPGTRIGVDVAKARSWFAARPPKTARQPRTPKPKAVLFADGKPAERLLDLLGGAELAGADVSALYAVYAAQGGQPGTLQGFTGWLVAEGARWLTEAAPRLAEAG